MVGVAGDWRLDVDRGPDWLFVRVHPSDHGALDPVLLADQVWSVCSSHFTYRLVLELECVNILHSYLIGQLVLLNKRVHMQGGVLRVCGLSPRNIDVLRACRLDNTLLSYANRGEAVMGHYRPTQPR